MKKSIIAVAGAAAVALTLAACGTAPESGSGSSETPTDTASETADGGETETGGGEAVEGFKACMVSDAGGFDDQSFNQSGKEGLDKAASELGVEVKAIESRDDSEYGPNIDSLISDGCTYIIGVGFLLEPAIQAAGRANPDLHFGLIDSALSNPDDFSTVELDNVKPLLFNTAEAAFLAGYAAAGMSESGKVGTFGGLPIPSVTIFMDGFADGIKQYNEDNGKAVELIGWDKDTQEGSFTGDFDDQSKGQDTTQGFLDQGVDIVMPVAGPVGLGAASALQAANGTMVWVDSDGFNSTSYGDIILTSVMKEIGQAVFDSVKASSEGSFSAEPYVGTLENGGVGIAPWHDFESKVPAELTQKIDEYKQKIISGELKVESPSTPS
ncbi:nucleoside-binding protein [Salana multivorans]|uniref:Nucleoside-binding protein n=1 Tax=Salana multivorans TaxID=120377 RepID=A0A3N2DCF5_9MICO|nr:BMP family ABC transporter substrate-binding protein [Salana multivorans]OJX97870.1 MAG: BMP family ABC transporter substrate-binding protein [Micrococcales bacterium 73-15]ROR97479.1 nucleoside-binding protein [Salana multivorans]